MRRPGRFALALLAVIVVGSLYNAGVARPLLDVLTLGALVVIVWAVLGLRKT